MPATKALKNLWMTITAGLIFVVFIPAMESAADLNGTWVLDPAKSDLGGQTGRPGRVANIPGAGGGYPGVGFPGGTGYPGGIGFPGGGIGFPGGGIGLPGGGYPGTGYPGGRRAGGYPGSGGDEGAGMPQEQMQDLRLQIVQNDTEVETTRTFTVNGEDRTVKQKFALDGSENANPASSGRGQFVSKSTWKNNRLVNSGTQTSSTRGEDYETQARVKEEYSLSKDRKTLTIKTTTMTPRGEMISRQVFNRQETSDLSGQ
jgi:hypothetical protein